jgi:hypothetical protein
MLSVKLLPAGWSSSCPEDAVEVRSLANSDVAAASSESLSFWLKALLGSLCLAGVNYPPGQFCLEGLRVGVIKYQDLFER